MTKERFWIEEWREICEYEAAREGLALKIQKRGHRNLHMSGEYRQPFLHLLSLTLDLCVSNSEWA